eukprot:s4608_g2.t1
MQSAFEKWNACNTRTVVFDKENRTTVNDFRSRSQSWLRDRCFLVTVTLSENAQDLRISAGNWQEWRLKLLQGVHAGDEVPASMDHWVGAAEAAAVMDAEAQAVDAEVAEEGADEHHLDEFADDHERNEYAEEGSGDEIDPALHSSWMFLQDSDSEDEGAEGANRRLPGSRMRAFKDRPEFVQ